MRGNHLAYVATQGICGHITFTIVPAAPKQQNLCVDNMEFKIYSLKPAVSTNCVTSPAHELHGGNPPVHEVHGGDPPVHEVHGGDQPVHEVHGGDLPVHEVESGYVVAVQQQAINDVQGVHSLLSPHTRLVVPTTGAHVCTHITH